MKRIARIAIIGTLVLGLEAPVLALDGKTTTEVGDPNRMICRTQKVTGSRLKTGKVCMTAAEWAAIKKDTRDTIEGAQQRRPTAGF